jgi:hypothetical protein
MKYVRIYVYETLSDNIHFAVFYLKLSSKPLDLILVFLCRSQTSVPNARLLLSLPRRVAAFRHF